MTNLILTRKAGESLRISLGEKAEYFEVLEVAGGHCKIRLLSTLKVERVKLRGTVRIAEDVEASLIALARGHAKWRFNAPKEVFILRTELVGGAAK